MTPIRQLPSSGVLRVVGCATRNSLHESSANETYRDSSAAPNRPATSTLLTWILDLRPGGATRKPCSAPAKGPIVRRRSAARARYSKKETCNGNGTKYAHSPGNGRALHGQPPQGQTIPESGRPDLNLASPGSRICCNYVLHHGLRGVGNRAVCHSCPGCWKTRIGLCRKAWSRPGSVDGVTFAARAATTGVNLLTLLIGELAHI